MRDYGVVSPKFWIGSTGKSLRGDADAQILALYLMTGPHAVSTGVYHCPLVYMIHETGLSEEGACKALQRLIEAKFCEYDEASESVFVRQMALFQIAETVETNDKRHKWLLREVASMPKPLRIKFISFYGVAYNIPAEPDDTRPIEAPSKPLRSQDHDHDHEHGQEHGHGHVQLARADVPRRTLSPDFEDFVMANCPNTAHRKNWPAAFAGARAIVGSGKATEDDLRRRWLGFLAFTTSNGYSDPSKVPSPQSWFALNQQGEPYWGKEWAAVPSKAQRAQDANITASLAWRQQQEIRDAAG